MSKKWERLEKIYQSNNCGPMKIVEYLHSKNVTVEFEDGTRVKAIMGDIKKGQVKNPYSPSVCGVGYIGLGKYKTRDEYGYETPTYTAWHNMFKRCYNEKDLARRPTYRGCSVDEKFHCFQNYGAWENEEFYQVEGQQMHLDKDILFPGNRIYSPDTCIFVPQNINSLVHTEQLKESKLPTGVVELNNKYNSQVRSIDFGDIYKCGFNTPEEAYKAYVEDKERLVKLMANKYRSQIPDRLYQALMRWTVEASLKNSVEI